MIKSIQDTTEDILQRHLLAFNTNDMDGIIQDYAPDAEIWRGDEIFAGTDAIAAFYTRIFSIFPYGATDFELQKRIVKDDKAYIVYTAESSKASIPFATDSFLIKDGKIIWQSGAALSTIKA